MSRSAHTNGDFWSDQSPCKPSQPRSMGKDRKAKTMHRVITITTHARDYFYLSYNHANKRVKFFINLLSSWNNQNVTDLKHPTDYKSRDNCESSRTRPRSPENSRNSTYMHTRICDYAVGNINQRAEIVSLRAAFDWREDGYKYSAGGSVGINSLSISHILTFWLEI